MCTVVTILDMSFDTKSFNVSNTNSIGVVCSNQLHRYVGMYLMCLLDVIVCSSTVSITKLSTYLSKHNVDNDRGSMPLDFEVMMTFSIDLYSCNVL